MRHALTRVAASYPRSVRLISLAAQQFVSDQLGSDAGGVWSSFGYLVLIMAGSVVLSVLLHTAIRRESR